MKKALLGIFIATGLIASGLVTGTILEDEAFSIETPYTDSDSYPDNETWGSFGTHDNTITDAEGNLAIASNESKGSFESDLFMKEYRIEFNSIIIDSEMGNSDKIDVAVVYFNENETPVGSQNINTTDGIISHEVEDPETDYYGYKFNVDMEDNGGTEPKLEEIDFSYTTFEVITDNLPFDLSEIVQIIPFFLGLIILVVSVVSWVIS